MNQEIQSRIDELKREADEAQERAKAAVSDVAFDWMIGIGVAALGIAAGLVFFR